MAGHIKGITVQLYTRTQTGTDAFNRPVYSEVVENVDNVLVAPVTDAEVVQSLDLTGKRAVYNLAIPKGDTHEWEDRKVGFFGKDWRVINFEAGGIEDLIPLDWNSKVQVSRYE